MTARLLACPSCDRHVRVGERACPFCGLVLPGSFGDEPGRAPPSTLIRSRLGWTRFGARAAIGVGGPLAFAAAAGCSTSTNTVVPYGVPPDCDSPDITCVSPNDGGVDSKGDAPHEAAADPEAAADRTAPGDADDAHDGGMVDAPFDTGASDGPYFGRVDLEIITEGMASTGFTPYRYVTAEFAPSPEVQTIFACGPAAVPPGTLASGQCFAGQAGAGRVGTIGYADGYAAGDAGVWGSTDDLTVSASGATIPAFTASVASPSVNLLNGHPMSASVSADFQVDWVALEPQTPVIAALYAPDGTSVVKCLAGIGASAVIVPATLMSHFTAGGMGTLEVLAVASKTLTLDNATVEVAALAGNAVPVTYGP